jgi:hypothetical protein
MLKAVEVQAMASSLASVLLPNRHYRSGNGSLVVCVRQNADYQVIAGHA